MITDVHTHILYDIDDGAVDIGESLKLIEMEMANGVGTAVLTPHFDPYRDSVDIFTQQCHERYNTLSQHITENNINISLVLGSETFYSPVLAYYSTLTPLCITDTRYLLIEFSTDTVFNKEFLAEFERLIIKFDITPIIAHTERYDHITRHINIVEELKNIGCIIQINAGYILHNYKDKFIRQLFKYGYIDMVASDCHDCEKRPPNLKKAIDLIDEKYDGYYTKRLENKYMIKAGETK